MGSVCTEPVQDFCYGLDFIVAFPLWPEGVMYAPLHWWLVWLISISNLRNCVLWFYHAILFRPHALLDPFFSWVEIWHWRFCIRMHQPCMLQISSIYLPICGINNEIRPLRGPLQLVHSSVLENWLTKSHTIVEEGTPVGFAHPLPGCATGSSCS